MLHEEDIGSELHDTIVDYVKDIKEGFRLVGTIDAMHDKVRNYVNCRI